MYPTDNISIKNPVSLILLIVIVLLLASRPVRTQNFFFTGYSIEEGLSQSVVNCVFQDSKGYIWVGTQNGLNRFDGYNFTVYSYNPADSTSISNSWIFSVDEDQEGNLWIGTKGGLNQWIRKEKRFRQIRYQPGYIHEVTDYPYDARVTRKGVIIINTPPVLTFYYPKTNKFRHFTSPLPYDGSVKDAQIPLLEDDKGQIWIGSTRGLACFNPLSETFRCYRHNTSDPASISDNNITALYEDREKNLWIGTAFGLNRFNPISGSFLKYQADSQNQQSASNNFIRAITEDPSGALWIGTEGGGLSRSILSADKKPIFENFTSQRNGLGHNIVMALMVDKSHNLWIGTLQGLSKTDLKPRKFHLYRRDDTPFSTNLMGNVIASIYKDETGNVWVGNWGQGLNIINRKTGQISYFSSRLTGKSYIPNDFIHIIFRDPWSNIWIGTRDGIFIYNTGEGSFVRFDKFFNNKRLPDFAGIRIYDIIHGRDDSFWIGTQNGLYRINLEKGISELYRQENPGEKHISGNLIYSLLEDREGLIWIATLNGLDVYNPGNGKITHYKKNNSSNSLYDNFVISLCEDHKGNIWIGTGSYALRYNKKDSLFTYFSQESGLPNNRIFAILEDQRWNLWFATGGGLCRLDTSRTHFRTFTVEEGLQSMEFNLRACCMSHDGEVFFGGMNGFNSFFPDSIKDNPFLPNVVFTSFYKTDKAEKEYLNIENSETVVLNYDDHTFTIEFASLEFTNPEKNHYAYKLEGVSDNWIETGNRHFVPFSNLPPGKYTFRVKGSNNDGVWNLLGPSLKIIINPPWWQSTWAWIAYFILLAGSVMMFIKIRERKLLHEKNLLEQKVHQRTLRIEAQNAEILQKNEELNKLNSALYAINATKDKFFSIIAHDLRNPFNTILGLSEMALDNNGADAREKTRKTMADIRDTAKHTFDLLQNLLLWARTQTGSLNFDLIPFDLSERITENIDLVKSQAKKKNIEISLICETPLPAIGDKRMIDTILRNLLTNAIKFTPQHGKISVTTTVKEGEIEIIVSDTGIGIELENLDRIFQLDNKYSRKGTEKERGSGLGLILCREFIEKHGGSIHAESRPGLGSKFIFSLPLPKEKNNSEA